ncbi:MAG: SUMF1/EgtB/PvdO family nonheme iron enzyme [Flavobacteriales bacterium]|nr:SUMF1/EgtB/PvdO family nonheme iron enzyme [Flavobacteriales bacterium]
MRPIHRHALLSAGLLFGAFGSNANNITTSAGTLSGNTGSHVNVRFSITWENSWRIDPDRWDAAWVFVKFRNATTGQWEHARLGDDVDHSPGTGTPAAVSTGLLTPGTPFDAASNWGVGVFIHRSAPGTGTFSVSDVGLRWNYAQNGVTYTEISDVRVFAIEMVRIPEGPFFVGSGGSEVGSFTDGAWTGGATIPFLITSENALNIAPSAGSLWGTSTSGLSTIGGTGTLSGDFPKGFKSFYAMKHEVTVAQYADFLNCLTRVQQNTRTLTNLAPGVTVVTNRYVMTNSIQPIFTIRNGIRCDQNISATEPITFYCDLDQDGTGNEANDGQWIACAQVNWDDIAAYLDWSCLRPMTELEFEKTCRGPLLPVPDEYAWGTTSITRATGTANEGTAAESTLLSGANANHGPPPGSLIGPVRVGVFAKAGSTREQAGAGYYGVLNLSDNLRELSISVGITSNRAFLGTLGNGALSTAGEADVPSWPNIHGAATSGGGRGGDYVNSPVQACVSARTSASSIELNRAQFTIRGVR